MSEAREAGFHDLLHELAQVRSLDFRGYKPASLERRVRKRMSQLNIVHYPEYTNYLREHPEELNFLLQVVLINVTEFFRDPHAWEALAQEALPWLLNRMRPGDTFRAWCAGCATGEEVYSLGILLADHFGPRLGSYDIKIYASDQDEEALALARRAEYPLDRLRRVRPEWRERYFSVEESGLTARVTREVRKLAIFGRANLVSDAPISHVDLLVCRNVLIYFETGLQRSVLRKIRYALDNDGILFLGKSESLLRGFANFRPVNSRWRIFRCVKEDTRRGGEPIASQNRELDQNRVMQHYVDTLKSGVVVLDTADNIVSANDAALALWGIDRAQVLGAHISRTPFVDRVPQLHSALQQVGSQNAPEGSQLRAKLPAGAGEKLIEIILRPMVSADGQRNGTLILTEDVSSQERLRGTVEELEATTEELHAANEELETSNEELQSTNEELETTNEELQSTTEELETTNEELHSLNEELQTINDELEQRNRDLEEASNRYAETLASLPLPVMVANDSGGVLLFNPAAEKLFDLEAKAVVGLTLKQLPIDLRLRDNLIRARESVLRSLQGTSFKRSSVVLGNYKGPLSVRVTPLPSSAGRGMLMIFEPAGQSSAGGPAAVRRAQPAAARRPVRAAKKPRRR